MTYLAFLVLFILPPVLLLLAVNRRLPRGGDGRPFAFAIGALCLIALAYATPWDGYMIERGIWWYGEGRVLARIGPIPVEEYAFFVLQPLLVGLWLRALPAARPDRALPPAPVAARWIGAALWAAAFLAGTFLIQAERSLYLGLILVWTGPVGVLQWSWFGGLLWAHRRLLAIGVAAPTLYLWLVDWIAIRAGVWHISGEYTLGPHLAGLPLEEAVFFLMTNLVVVQGMLMFVWGKRARDAGRVI
jgi:lycopene beta-cyclase